MADETKDVPKVEQLAILIRYRAIGLHHLKDCSADNIANAIFSLLSNQGIDLKYCVGQCYDGANVMSGWANGAQQENSNKTKAACYVSRTVRSYTMVCWFSAASKILKNLEAILIVLDEGMKDRTESIGIRTQMDK
ncbi:hypothetical protein PR048_001491 [Dryococelus australis]|uniref:DUF4371 domain-containing protein n=1 Tax=Dryococelus australis TaxID=614101 RepID=A0ABQ9IHH8_9NEOP|nr:hypothetical protein PR048_001491 [Dryococelus australis]